MPMKESFMNSIKKRKKFMRNSLKEYSQSSERSKSNMKIRNFKHNHSQYRQHRDEFKNGKMVNVLDHNSIFDHLPENIRPNLSTSAETQRKYFKSKNMADFK